MSDEHRPVTRRAYLADLAAGGAVLVGSVLWGYAARTVAPAEGDHHRKAGDMVAPSPSPTPTARPTPPPELDHIPTAGAVAPPRPPRESDVHPKPGQVRVAPRPK